MNGNPVINADPLSGHKSSTFHFTAIKSKQFHATKAMKWNKIYSCDADSTDGYSTAIRVY